MRLVPASSASRHSARPPAIPAARAPEPAAEPGHDRGRPVRGRHAARHARTSELRPRSRTSLSIRSAERRRRAAELSGPVTAAGLPRTEPTELPDADAELVASAAGEVMFGELFDRLGAGARSLLIRAAAYRGPVLRTAAVRGMFGGRLAAVYAPEVLASFGAGPARIAVRIVAPDGSAYREALAADRQARRAAGLQLLRDPRLGASPSARAALADGQVDAPADQPGRAGREPAGSRDRLRPARPGASPGLPLRIAEPAAPAGTAHRMLSFLRAQRSPYLPACAGLAGSVLTVRFGAPAPLGLLQDHEAERVPSPPPAGPPRRSWAGPPRPRPSRPFSPALVGSTSTLAEGSGPWTGSTC